MPPRAAPETPHAHTSTCSNIPTHARPSIILDTYFRERPDVFVGGEGYLCRDTRDRTGWVVPDCVVAFGVDARAILDRNGYVIEEVGKPPDFVLEIASESTGRADYTTKRDIYAGHGVGEYWRFDSTGGERHDAALSERLVDGAYEPMPMHHERDGVIRGYSPVLGLELHWDEGRLRIYDPADGRVRCLRDIGGSHGRQRDSAIRERSTDLGIARSLRYCREGATTGRLRGEDESAGKECPWLTGAGPTEFSYKSPSFLSS